MSHEKDTTGTCDEKLDVAAAEIEILLIEIKTTNRFLSKVVERERGRENNRQDTSRALLQELQGLRSLREADEEGIKVIPPLTPPRSGSANYFLLSMVLVFMVLFVVVFVR